MNKEFNAENLQKVKNYLEDTLFPWMQDEKSLALVLRTGSHAFGTNTENSDEDYKVVVLPPKEFYLGLNSFDGFDKTGGKNFSNSSKDDLDVVAYHFSKFVAYALAGKPTHIEILFTHEDDILYMNEQGRMLLEIRNEFLTKDLFVKFQGYIKSESFKIHKSTRNDLLEKYGYDTKSFMHTVRLAEELIQIAREGTLDTKRPNAPHLVELRNGLLSKDEAETYLKNLLESIDEVLEKSTLPDKPNKEKINKWLVDLNLNYLNNL